MALVELGSASSADSLRSGLNRLRKQADDNGKVRMIRAARPTEFDRWFWPGICSLLCQQCDTPTHSVFSIRSIASFDACGYNSVSDFCFIAGIESSIVAACGD